MCQYCGLRGNSGSIWYTNIERLALTIKLC